MPKTVGDLGKFIVAKGLKSYPKCKKFPNLVTLLSSYGIGYQLNITALVSDKEH